MQDSTLRAWFLNGLQRGVSFTRHINLVKKFRKFFCAALATLFFIPPVYAQDASFIPPSMGTVLDSYRFESSVLPSRSQTPLIVHIQDAHESYEIQKNIASLIMLLVRQYHFKLVFEEGNSGYVDTSKVFWTGNGDFRARLADQFLRESKITGPELAQVRSEGAFHLYGAEEASLYEKNVRSREGLSFYRTEIQNQLRKLERDLVRQTPHVFSQGLLNHYRKSESFWRGLGPPPFNVQAGEKIWDQDFFMKLGVRDQEALDYLVTKRTERELMDKIRLVSVLKKISDLRATREDMEAYSKMAGASRDLLRDRPILREFLDQVVRFYDIARQRDLVLIQKTLQGMSEGNEDRAILVSGGFHTQGIAQFLRDRGVSYVVVAPVSHPAPAETLRAPNLFNLPRSEGRLLFDLRAMNLAKGEEKETELYSQLKRDAIELWGRVAHREENIQNGTPATGIRRGAVFVVALKQIPPEFILHDLARWMAVMIRTNASDFVVAVNRQRDLSVLNSRLKEYVPEIMLRRKIQTIRLLTPQDFGAANRLLHGKVVFLLGNPTEKRKMELLGLGFDQFFPFSWSHFSYAEGLFAKELYELQKSYRAIITSS